MLEFLSAETRITGTLAVALGLFLYFNPLTLGVPMGFGIWLVIMEIVVFILAVTFLFGDIADTTN